MFSVLVPMDGNYDKIAGIVFAANQSSEEVKHVVSTTTSPPESSEETVIAIAEKYARDTSTAQFEGYESTDTLEMDGAYEFYSDDRAEDLPIGWQIEFMLTVSKD